MVSDIHVMKIVEESDLVVHTNIIFSWFDDRFAFSGNPKCLLMALLRRVWRLDLNVRMSIPSSPKKKTN
jgi:hypothetical protein